jgi:hypothetical protein
MVVIKSKLLFYAGAYEEVAVQHSVFDIDIPI